MTDRQARRIEILLRLQCLQNHNVVVTVRSILALQLGAPPESMRTQLDSEKALLTNLLTTLAKDDQAERTKQAQTQEQQEALEAELQRLDDALTTRSPLGLR